MSQPPDSLWWSQLPPVTPRDALTGDRDVDVCIVGGGYTGLWTALGLLKRSPSLRVLVVEAHVCGFGASGRNGGWASALFPLGDRAVRRYYGDDAPARLREELRAAVPALGDALREEGIEADFVQGGTITVARNAAQARRLRTGDPAGWLDERAVRERLTMAGALGGHFSPDCARLHPARLVRGLADAVERRGGTIVEETPARAIEPASPGHRARVRTDHGVVRADVVVRATEGFTPLFADHHRDVVPLYSLMIATAPLAATTWDAIGLARHETFADDRHLVIYGQRTADNRLVFGGRGAPYHWGSRVRPDFDHDESVFARLESTLRELFPAVTEDVTHRWGGPLAMTRQGRPFASVNHARGLAAAGGYTGDGVVLSRVCAEAVATAIVEGPQAPLSTVAQPLARRWECEPLRWLGVNTGLTLARAADRAEHRGRTSRAASLLGRLLD